MKILGLFGRIYRYLSISARLKRIILELGHDEPA